MNDKDGTPGGQPIKGPTDTTGGTPFYGISNGNTGNGLTICDKVEQLLEGISRDTIQQPDNLPAKGMSSTTQPTHYEPNYGIVTRSDAEISETVRKFFEEDAKKTAQHGGDPIIETAKERNTWTPPPHNGMIRKKKIPAVRYEDPFQDLVLDLGDRPIEELEETSQSTRIDNFYKELENPDYNKSEGSKQNTTPRRKGNGAQQNKNRDSFEMYDIVPTNYILKKTASFKNSSVLNRGQTVTKPTVSNVDQQTDKPETRDVMQQTDVVKKYHRGRRFSEPSAFDLSRSYITELLRESLKLPAETLLEKDVQNVRKGDHQPAGDNGMEIENVSLNGNGVEEEQKQEEQNLQQDDEMNETGEEDISMEAYSPTISERDIIDENAPPPKKAKLDPLQVNTEPLDGEEYEEVEEYSSTSSRSRSPSPQRQGFFFKLGTNQPVVKETRNSPSSPEPAGGYQKQLINAAAEKKRELLLQAEQLKRRKIIEKALSTTPASARNELLQVKSRNDMPHRKLARDSPTSPDANLNHSATPVYYRVNRDYSTIPRPQKETDATKMVQDKILGEEAVRANGGEPGPSEPVKHTVPLKKTSALNQALAELLSRPVTKIVLEKHHYLPEFRPTHEYIPQIVDSAPFETHDEQMKLLYKISSNSSWVPPNRDAPLPHERGIDYWNWTAGQFISWIASFCHNKYVLSNLLLANLNGKIIYTHEPDYSLLRNFGLNVEVSNVICHNFRILKDKCRIYGNLGTLRLPQGFF
ncbi:unnamed protein product [Caenorhabditis brenneri]